MVTREIFQISNNTNGFFHCYNVLLLYCLLVKKILILNLPLKDQSLQLQSELQEVWKLLTRGPQDEGKMALVSVRPKSIELHLSEMSTHSPKIEPIIISIMDNNMQDLLYLNPPETSNMLLLQIRTNQP